MWFLLLISICVIVQCIIIVFFSRIRILSNYPKQICHLLIQIIGVLLHYLRLCETVWQWANSRYFCSVQWCAATLLTSKVPHTSSFSFSMRRRRSACSWSASSACRAVLIPDTSNSARWASFSLIAASRASCLHTET